MSRTQLVKTCATLMLVVALAGCGTILNGGSQSIAVNTVPAGAWCSVSRENAAIGWITSTPGSIDVSRSRQPLTLRCEKPGYPPVMGTVGSIANGIVFGDLLFPPAALVDFSTGANYDYRETVFIRFEPSVTATALQY